MRLPKTYNPREYEADIYGLWERNGAFEPKDDDSKGVFSMVAPPPNANANLHIGYGLTIAIEDVIVRYQRMQGKSTVFVPGADHAGFETWVVYEKKLEKEGKSRFDFSRENLYKQVWDFVEKNKQNFQSQIRALGASVDWKRFTYTLDDKVVNQTYKTFQKMWDGGLIYRGERIVNFCTFHGTSFADIEVVHEEEKTKLWYIAYPLADDSGELVIATTRPETKLGQAALMVSPKDKRYQKYVGKKVLQPLVPDKPIPVIADDYVDMSFGTGVVTVTPAHDPNDFEVAQKHNLPALELITTDGKTSENVPEAFRGLTVKEARKAVIEALESAGYLRKTEDYSHTVAKCYKCGTLIEPLLREQWFVKMEPLAKPAIEALKKKEIKFYPDSRRKQLINYLEQLRDWNISRQIAWGIPIPAFQNVEDHSDWIFDTRVNQEYVEVAGQKYKRDPDVFDTWFSSSSWPYVTLDYPSSKDFKRFYPLNLMETAGEILYPWVSRMIILGLYETKKMPFKEVYIHGLVLAEGGAKMSKSLGNVVDSMEVVHKYGSDALRMGLLAGRVPGVNRGYDHRKVEDARNFNNKLWNIARYAEAKEKTDQQLSKTPADHWILMRLSKSTSDINKSLSSYRLAEAYSSLYHFVWNDLADWYVEASKGAGGGSVLIKVLEDTLKLAHPFAPFVTETIWQTMHEKENDLLINGTWPQEAEFDRAKAEAFEEIMAIVTEVRRISRVLDLKKSNLLFRNSSLLTEQADLIARLANLESVKEVEDKDVGLQLTSTNTDAWINVDGSQAKRYHKKLEEELKDAQAQVERLQDRLKSSSYLKNAPSELVEESKDQLKEQKISVEKLEQELNVLTKS